MEGEIRQLIQQSTPTQDSWLSWVIYAAEIGYRYVGDEYWQTFEAETPGWVERGDRRFIRDCFLEFHKRYNGARPSGRWAQHFSIICWPIANAILPKDLQRELVRILHDLRFHLTSEAFASPSTLGSQIAARNMSTKPRFLQFLQETELAGLIASALLRHGQSIGDEIIEPLTLERIVKDLDGERGAGVLLREAQRVARQLTLRGFAPRGAPSGTQTGPSASDGAPNFELRLALRSEAVNVWDVLCEVPDLSPLLQTELYRETLTSARCTVEGAPRPLARGRVLGGTSLVRLDRWPAPAQQLIRFENSPESLGSLLASECVLPPGPPWLFRIRQDGLAHGIRTRLVRPGKQYLLVWPQGVSADPELLRPTKSTCSGLELRSLETPAQIDSDYQHALAQLGVGVARSLRLWPVGLPPRSWDGEGHLVYSTMDAPLLAVQSDHDVGLMWLRLHGGGDTPVCLGAVRSHTPVFLGLPRLPVGHHTLEFLSGTSRDSATVHTRAEIDVCSPGSWLPDRSSHRLLFVEVSPNQPSFEDLFQGRVSIAVHGPAKWRVTPYLTLRDPVPANSSLLDKRLATLTLPIEEDAWARCFASQVLNADAVLEVADGASTAEIRLEAEDLGVLKVKFSRALTPVRWVVRRSGSNYELRLVDDSSEVQRVVHSSFDAPDRLEEIPMSSAMRGLTVPNPGGLYIAAGACDPCGVLLPRHRMRSFDALRAGCTFLPTPRTCEAIDALLDAFKGWSNARMVGGTVVAGFKRQVLGAIHDQVILVLCGESWAAIERSTRGRRLGPSGLRRLYGAVSSRPPERRVVSWFHSQCVARGTDSTQFLKLFQRAVNELAGRFGNDGWLGEALLRLVDTPGEFREWAGDRAREAIKQGLETMTAARLARYAILGRNALNSPTRPAASDGA